MASGCIPTFGELLGKIKKVDPNNGLIEKGYLYDFTESNDMQKYKWTHAVLKMNIYSFEHHSNDCSNDKLMFLYQKFIDFNHYAFVQKLNGILRVKNYLVLCIIVFIKYSIHTFNTYFKIFVI